MSTAPVTLMLWSSTTGDVIQQKNQTRLENLLIAKKLEIKKIDGSDPDSKDRRDACFAVSGVRGNYPQCFLEHDNGTLVFVGVWDTIESLVECNDIPEEVIAQNPDIKTFNTVFANAAKST